MTDYKATPEQWEVQEKFAPESEDAMCFLELRSRIEDLEDTLYYVRCNHLRLVNTIAKLAPNRMEFYGALHPDVCEEDIIIKFYEALKAQHKGKAVFHGKSQPTPNDCQIRSSNHPEKPDNSLVKRVVKALDEYHVVGALDESWDAQARAAIHEVAAWLRERGGWNQVTVAALLEEEAKQ